MMNKKQVSLIVEFIAVGLPWFYSLRYWNTRLFFGGLCELLIMLVIFQMVSDHFYRRWLCFFVFVFSCFLASVMILRESSFVFLGQLALLIGFYICIISLLADAVSIVICRLLDPYLTGSLDMEFVFVSDGGLHSCQQYAGGTSYLPSGSVISQSHSICTANPDMLSAPVDADRMLEITSINNQQVVPGPIAPAIDTGLDITSCNPKL